MRLSTGIVLLALVGCSSAPDVVATGKNQYVVRPRPASGVSTDAQIKAFGIRRANEYCDAKGQHAVITVGERSDLQMLAPQRAEVRFICRDK